MTENPTEPAGINEKGVAPKTRFSTPGGVWNAFQQAKTLHDRGKNRLADIRAAYDRMPPALSKEEEEQLNGFPNINRGELRSKCDTLISAWLDHNCGGDRLAEIRCKRHGYTEFEQQDYSVKTSRFFNEAIQQWEFDEGSSLAPYVLESVIRDTQMGLFGVGPIWFKDTTDWRFCSLPMRVVYVPEGTKITLTNCPCLWIEHPYTATELYDLREADGWDKKAVLDFLYKKINPQQGSQLEDRAAWENRINNNLDLGGQEFTQYILVHAYVQEFNDSRDKNGISHYVVGAADATEFLYKKEREYKTYGHVMIAFCDSAGPEGDWHGVKGFGDLCFDLCHFNDKFFNHLAFTAVATSTPVFQGSGEADRQKLAQMRLSRFGIITDLQINQMKVNADINGCVAVMGESSRTLDRNTRIFPQNDSGPRGEAPTATQVAFDRQDQAQFTGLQIKFYRTVCLDRTLTEMHRRLTQPASKYPESLPGGKAAAEFRRKCKEADVPEKCYRDVEYVRASRSGGSGNMALDGQKANTVLGIATPGPGQLQARKEVVASQYGWERVPEFVQDEPVPDNIDVVIGLENGLINMGQMVEAFANQDHQRHLGTPDPQGKGHLSVLNVTRMAAMQIQEMGLENALDDAVKLNRTMEACFAHCDMHANFLATEPKFAESAKVLRGMLDQFAQFLKTFTDAVGAAMQERQPQGPQMSAEDQAKLMKAQIDIQIKQAFADQDLENKRRAQDLKLGNLAERSAAKEMLADQSHLQELGRRAEETALDLQKMELDLAKTRAQHNLETVGNGSK